MSFKIDTSFNHYQS